MAAADVDGDGVIDYNEFVAATMNVNQLEKEEVIWRAFSEFDTDGSGSISASELEHVRPSSPGSSDRYPAQPPVVVRSEAIPVVVPKAVVPKASGTACAGPAPYPPT